MCYDFDRFTAKDPGFQVPINLPPQFPVSTRKFGLLSWDELKTLIKMVYGNADSILGSNLYNDLLIEKELRGYGV